MQARPLQTGIARRLARRPRLARVCTSARLFLRGVTQTHALEEAARFAGLRQALCCKMLPSHGTVAVAP
jgi:hypothetical protein